VAVDLTQILFLPAFAEGFASPINDVLDVATAIGMVLLLGWHWAFLPTLLAEMIPVVDLVPSWTAAVWIVTRHAGREASPPLSLPSSTTGKH